MANLNRRDFLKNSAFLTGAAWLSTSVFGCSSTVKVANNSSAIQFLHGVACGDPLTDSLILWTKVTPTEQPDAVQLLLEVSESADSVAILPLRRRPWRPRRPDCSSPPTRQWRR